MREGVRKGFGLVSFMCRPTPVFVRKSGEGFRGSLDFLLLKVSLRGAPCEAVLPVEFPRGGLAPFRKSERPCSYIVHNWALMWLFGNLLGP